MSNHDVVVVIRGDVDSALQTRLQARFNKHPRITLESQQQQESDKRDALMSLFVVKPTQTGFTALAELRQAAMTNPDGTAVLVAEPVGMGSIESDADLDSALDELIDMGVGVFNEEDDVADFIEKASEQTGDYTTV